MHMRLAAALVLVALLPAAFAAASTDATPRPRILVFTKTAGFRHDSIPAGVRAVRELAAARGIRVESTANGAAFNTRSLKRYRAVVFLSTTGDVLTAPQQRAFERYVRGGGGFVGVHAAADTEYGWAWYSRLVGARFRSHPAVQPAAVDVRTRSHPSTAGLPRGGRGRTSGTTSRRGPPRGTLVLATLDETSYMPGEGAMGPGHPIAWAHSRLGGRAWYTGGGHTAESFAEPLFRRHLIGGIRWAARLTPPRG